MDIRLKWEICNWKKGGIRIRFSLLSIRCRTMMEMSVQQMDSRGIPVHTEALVTKLNF